MDVHLSRHAALLLADQSGIARELNHVPGFGPPGQLGIERFIAPGTEVRCFLHPLQEIGIAEPGRHNQSGLVDHLGPSPHRLPSERGWFREVEPFARDLYDTRSPCLERDEVTLLVLNALLEN